MARKPRKNIGIIGLGIIGTRVAATLRAKGFHVYVWNRTPKAAPNFLGSPSTLAEFCDVIQLFVADAQALFDVLDAMEGKLNENHTVICSATVGPEATIEAAKLVEEHGAKFLDAPFTGSKDAAANGQLVYYIGGEDEVFRGVAPMLEASSKAIVKIGAVGQAATVKVATNVMAAVNIQTLAEALAIVKQSGVPADIMADALEHHGVRSALLDMKLGKMIHGDYEPHFTVKHMFKDVQLAIHIANSLEIDVPATTATAGVMFGALNRGWADLDYSALAKVYESETDEPSKPAVKAEPKAEIPLPKAAESEPAKETLGVISPVRAEEIEPLKNGQNKVAAMETKNGDSPKNEEKKPFPAAFNHIRRWFGADVS